MKKVLSVVFSKKSVLVLLCVNMLLGFTSLAQAQTATFDYSTSKVQTSIEKYLCAPTQGGGSYWSKNSSVADLNNKPNTSVAENNVAGHDLYNCINRLYKFSIVVAAVIGVFFIVIAGYLYMASDGDEESVTKAKSILVSTIASLLILFIGFILLKALNPDLIQFQNIQPPSVVYTTTTPTAANPDIYSNPNATVTDIAGSGCAFQTDKQKNEAPQLVPQLTAIVKNICYNIVKNNNGASYPGTQGKPPTISSIIGLDKHAANSYHYKGCAIDFADGGGLGFFNFSDKTGRPTGVAIFKEALANGISIDRINPDTDRDPSKSNHIHIDLGSNCPITSGRSSSPRGDSTDTPTAKQLSNIIKP